MDIKKFFTVSHQSSKASIGLLILRLIVGLAFMIHGWPKIQNPMGWAGPTAPFPAVLMILAAVAEFCGGLGLFLGFLTPLATFGIACTMAVAAGMHAFILHDPWINAAGGSSFEPALGYLAVAIMFCLVGPGQYSVDHKVFNKG